MCLSRTCNTVDAMDIVPSRPLSGRKRAWGEEEYEPSKQKRALHSWIRERPPVTELDYPIIQQVQSLTLGAQVNDIQMIMDEPVWQRPMLLPPSLVSRPVSPLPPIHNNSVIMPSPHLPGASTQVMAATTTSELTRPLDSAHVRSTTKKRFAMGPRADCERCLAREPGHYGHWL
ncbi:unnamed protein product [Rhizoctonia solani]|uniref:Uncharacterized protein n=1 Tax=Rhizoctonia solani TaxID=456999 RepID=A0A8H3DWT8_9AGAM|nr:unnamed protein product [Rhizoctonia solani]